MATKTSNYEFNKPEQNDFYDVDVQNENWDKLDKELSEFDDSGATEDIKSFPDFLTKFVTGNKVAVTLRNLKAGLQFVLHAGQIVNNCMTDNTGLPLSAAQGKVLKDLIDTTNNNLSNAGIPTVKKITDLYAIKKSGFYCYDAGASNAPMSSRGGMVIANYLSDAWISLNVVPYALSKIYTNSKYNSTWTGWSELASKNDLTTVSELLSQPPSEYCTFSQWAAIAERSGNEVTLSFNVGGKIKEISTIFLLKTLPEKYRPKSNKHISYRTQEGYDMAIFIMTDGQIQLFTGGKAVSGYFLRQVITYPAA